jgi:hydrogenase/urease accessory protein HupE
MTRTHKYRVRLASLIASLLPALASAHHGAGETSSFAAGALHPLSGIDHVAGFVIVGLLAARLAGRLVERYLAHLSAVLLGLLVAAWTSDTDGWRFAAGFMLSGAGLIAAAIAAMKAATRFIPVATHTAASFVRGIFYSR